MSRNNILTIKNTSKIKILLDIKSCTNTLDKGIQKQLKGLKYV